MKHFFKLKEKFGSENRFKKRTEWEVTEKSIWLSILPFLNLGVFQSLRSAVPLCTFLPFTMFTSTELKEDECLDLMLNKFELCLGRML